MPLPIILGSSSKWRKDLLEKTGLSFSVMNPRIEEKNIRHSDPKKLTLLIAHAKADALISKIHQPSLLITVDQVVFCHEEIFEKPSSPEDVNRFYTRYAKYPCQTVTAVVITHTKTKQRVEGVDIATVYMKPIPKKAAKQYIQKGEIFHCAGGFQIEDETGNINPYIDRIEGTIDSVKGMPIKLTQKLLKSI